MFLIITDEIIEAQSYKGRTDIEEITLKNTKAIKEEAFMGCINLKKINLPNSLEYIGDKAFYGCRGGLKVSPTDQTNPVSLKHIGISAFEDCEGLNGSIRLSEQTEYISNRAFCNCDNYYTSTEDYISFSLRIPQGLNIKRIGDYAFYNCKYANLILPANLEKIGNYAYASCKFTYLGISNNVSIGEGAFIGSSIQEVFLPNVISIGASAFKGCFNLNKVWLGSKIKKIERYTFSSCSSLYYIYIPYSVLEILEGAFAACGSNQGYLTVSFGTHSMVPIINSYSFDYTSECYITVPDNLFDSWESTWENIFENSYGKPNGVDFYYQKLSDTEYIRFNVGSYSFIAEKGMNFGDWANSDYSSTYAIPESIDSTIWSLSKRIKKDVRKLSSTNYYSKAVNWPCSDRVLSIANLNHYYKSEKVNLTDIIKENGTYTTVEGMIRIPYLENGEYKYRDYEV